MKRIAANVVLVKGRGVVKNAVVQIDDKGVVESVFELADYRNEPFATVFYNGVLTRWVDLLGDGEVLLDVDEAYIEEGVCIGNGVALWTNISLTELRVEKSTIRKRIEIINK